MKQAYFGFLFLFGLGVPMLISQCAVAYPAIRLGMSSLLVAGVLLSVIGVGCFSLALASKKQSGFRRHDWVTALMPVAGAIAFVGTGIVLGVIAA
jgi:hypothetical protein